MLYLDTFGAWGGVGRCSLGLLPALSRRVAGLTLAGRSHVVDSYRGAFTVRDAIRLWNLEKPRLRSDALAVRAWGKIAPGSISFTHALLHRARIQHTNRSPVLINYPQELAAPRRNYSFDIFLHDLNWRHYPGNFARPDDLDRRCLSWAQRAGRVFTNSEFTRDDVIHAYGLKSQKVFAAPLAPPAITPPAPDPEKLQRLGLTPGAYFFYPAAHGLHKGHDVLADALAHAPASTFPVVITASISPDGAGQPSALRSYRQAVTTRLQALQRQGKIISLPNLSWDDVLLIAASSRAYVLPSRFEGFGFPLVEALALGKPALCSEIPAFREILDRYAPDLHALTFPPGDSAQLRELLAANSYPDDHPDPPPATFTWTWADTANAIASAYPSHSPG
jgi:glycosyltransferase involved in cell wall biosynthesis